MPHVFENRLGYVMDYFTDVGYSDSKKMRDSAIIGTLGDMVQKCKESNIRRCGMAKSGVLQRDVWF